MAVAALLLIVAPLLALMALTRVAKSRERQGRTKRPKELCSDHDTRREAKPETHRDMDLAAPDVSKMPAESKRPLLDKVLEADPLDGIIAQLTRDCGGNVHEKGVVSVTASSCSLRCKPEVAVDLRSDSYFASKHSPNSWICYDFGGRRVTPTSYSIRSCCGQFHLKSWVLEVSNDNEAWEVVDSRENNEELNAPHVTRNFAISAPTSGAFRFVRLRQTGENHRGYDYLRICALELFGALYDE